MPTPNTYKKAICNFLLLFIFTVNLSAQLPKGKFLPHYPVKSAVIKYQLTIRKGWTGDSLAVLSPYVNISFDDYGLLVRKQAFGTYITPDSRVAIVSNDFYYYLDDPKDCATKYKFGDSTYDGILNGEGVQNKLIQDLIHYKVNKQNYPAFRSFSETGNEIFLGLNCKRYQFMIFNWKMSCMEKNIYLVYNEICLSATNYIVSPNKPDFFVSGIEAYKLEENIPIPPASFEVPANLRVIDGDKIDATSKEASAGFSSLIVNYTTKSDYGQMQEEGKKKLYIKDNGKASVEEIERSIVEYHLAPELKHYKKIRDQDSEIMVNYLTKTFERRELVKGNYNDKSSAELNYYFENKLYDTTVKPMGKINFLGKECSVFEIITGVERLEVYVWNGVFLQIKRFICLEILDCKQYQLTGEETAVSIQENVVIPESVFKYPEDFNAK